jgi:hypothetical protein
MNVGVIAGSRPIFFPRNEEPTLLGLLRLYSDIRHEQVTYSCARVSPQRWWFCSKVVDNTKFPKHLIMPITSDTLLIEREWAGHFVEILAFRRPESSDWLIHCRLDGHLFAERQSRDVWAEARLALGSKHLRVMKG